MDSKTLTLAGLVITVQIGLFAWLKYDIADLRSDLGTRVDRLERDVAFIRGQLSLALPALTASDPTPPIRTPANPSQPQ